MSIQTFMWLESKHCWALTWFLGVLRSIRRSPLVPKPHPNVSTAWSRSTWVFRGICNWKHKKTYSACHFIPHCFMEGALACAWREVEDVIWIKQMDTGGFPWNTVGCVRLHVLQWSLKVLISSWCDCADLFSHLFLHKEHVHLLAKSLCHFLQELLDLQWPLKRDNSVERECAQGQNQVIISTLMHYN